MAGVKKVVDRPKVYEILKSNPQMTYGEFKKKSDMEISMGNFYNTRSQYQKNIGLDKPVRTKKKVKAKKVKPKRKYTKSKTKRPLGKSKKKMGRPPGKKNVFKSSHRTVAYLLLWSRDTTRMTADAIDTAKDMVRCLQKGKRMNLQLIQTLVPPRLELREGSSKF